jgi:transposase-like protein
MSWQNQRGPVSLRNSLISLVCSKSPGCSTKLAPLLAEGLRKRRAGKAGRCWHVDETYVKVAGEWCYLYRAIDRDGTLVDVYLSETRDIAKAFLRSARSVTQVEPEQVTTDGHTSYPKAIADELGTDVDHRTSQYKNNVMEQDHRGIKGRYRSMRGFKAFGSADRFCRAFDELPAPDQLHQPERFARPSAGHPRPACRCAAGPDLRRLIQPRVVRLLRTAQLATKADRTVKLAQLSAPAQQLDMGLLRGGCPPEGSFRCYRIGRINDPRGGQP